MAPEIKKALEAYENLVDSLNKMRIDFDARCNPTIEDTFDSMGLTAEQKELARKFDSRNSPISDLISTEGLNVAHIIIGFGTLTAAQAIRSLERVIITWLQTGRDRNKVTIKVRNETELVINDPDKLSSSIDQMLRLVDQKTMLEFVGIVKDIKGDCFKLKLTDRIISVAAKPADLAQDLEDGKKVKIRGQFAGALNEEARNNPLFTASEIDLTISD